MKRPEPELPLPVDVIDRALRAGVRSATASYEQIPDLLQDAWVALLARRERLDEVSPPCLPAYIRRMGRSAAVDRLRKLGARKRGGEARILNLDQSPPLVARSRDPQEITVAREELTTALRATAGGGRRLAQVVQLVFVEGLEPAEAARALGIGIGSVHSAVSRARARAVAERDPD